MPEALMSLLLLLLRILIFSWGIFELSKQYVL